MSTKFIKKLLGYGFREYNPPFTNNSDTSNKRFFQKKIIKIPDEDSAYDVYLDVYVYNTDVYPNGNVFPGLIQFTCLFGVFDDPGVSLRVNIEFDFTDYINIDDVIQKMIKYHNSNYQENT